MATYCEHSNAPVEYALKEEEEVADTTSRHKFSTGVQYVFGCFDAKDSPK